MAQVADRRLLTAEGRIHSQAKSGKNSDGQIGTETTPVRVILLLSFHKCSRFIHSSIESATWYMLLTASLHITLKETSAVTLGTEHSKLFVYMGVDPFTLRILYRGEPRGLSSVESSSKRAPFYVDKFRILLPSKWTLDSKLSRRWSWLPLSTGMWCHSLADRKRRFLS